MNDKRARTRWESGRFRNRSSRSIVARSISASCIRKMSCFSACGDESRKYLRPGRGPWTDRISYIRRRPGGRHRFRPGRPAQRYYISFRKTGNGEAWEAETVPPEFPRNPPPGAPHRRGWQASRLGTGTPFAASLPAVSPSGHSKGIGARRSLSGEQADRYFLRT